MQSSNKASKKTKIAEETVASAPEVSAAAERTPKPRTSRSSTPKKDTSETGPARHRKVSSPETIAESAPVSKTLAAAAAGFSSSTGSRVLDPVGVMASTPDATQAIATPAEISPSREEIAKLAYSYWIARGAGHGGAEQDWLRAERELKAKR